MAGDLNVSSVAGTGAQFELTLPRRAPDSTE
jgi:signal transduction histidine kinase